MAGSGGDPHCGLLPPTHSIQAHRIPQVSYECFFQPKQTSLKPINFLPRYTGIAVLEMDFERIDINQCPKGEGNNKPNRFAGTARCKEETTECEPLQGWGFRRGGYQCRCKPGFRIPSNIRRPFLGEIIERASAEQYYNGFDCLKIGCNLNSLLTFKLPKSHFLRGPKTTNTMGEGSVSHSGKASRPQARVSKLHDRAQLTSH